MLLSQVIAHSCNIGYERSHNLQLVKLNNQPIKSLKQLKKLLYTDKDSNLVFEFRSGQQMILDRAAAMESQTQVVITFIHTIIIIYTIYCILYSLYIMNK